MHLLPALTIMPFWTKSIASFHARTEKCITNLEGLVYNLAVKQWRFGQYYPRNSSWITLQTALLSKRLTCFPSKYLCIYVIMSDLLRDGGCLITVRVSGVEWREAKNLHNRRLCSLCTLLFGHCVNSSLVFLPCIWEEAIRPHGTGVKILAFFKWNGIIMSTHILLFALLLVNWWFLF